MTRERVAQGTESTGHLVQLFDDPESLAETVGRYLFEGWQAGETLLVVARPEHWARASQALALNGCPVDAAIASGQLVVRDAATTLAGFLRNGRPMPERFARTVARLVGDLVVQRRAPLRIYGEMVDILAAQGDLACVCEVEALWNELGSRHPFRLLCGYSSGHFGDARTAAKLREICEAHDRASAKPTDLLGSWLLADRRSRFHTDGR
jgi:hypothetical protein